MASDTRVRFAPSPTGYLHVGGARTALYNYLFARKTGGKFILRIEDTDRSRYQPDAAAEIFDSLRWLGLDWDEGPEAGGDYGPYVQSERSERYRTHARELLDAGHAYRCFCTAERLEELRRSQEKAKQSRVGYDRHCRKLDPAEAQRMAAEGKPYVVRLKVPVERSIKVHDVGRGDIEVAGQTLEDQVLLKSDGFPTYHLANVVDDHFMRISHVLRDQGWLSSLPLHILLYEAFGWEPPVFAHVPVILAPGGGKLSKRKGAASVMDYKRAGYLPEAVVNFLALLGWSPGDDREKMSREELIQAFSLERISAKAAVFDEQKLEWINGLYMQDRSVESIAPEVIARWKECGLVAGDSDDNDPYALRVIELLKDRSKRITDLADSAVYFFEDPREYDPKAVKKRFKDDAGRRLEILAQRLEGLEEFTEKAAEDVFRAYAEEEQLSAGKLIHPTRLAVSGVSFGPGLFELLATLGKETVVRRMRRAVAWLGERAGEG